jgi:hypothetical protein
MRTGGVRDLRIEFFASLLIEQRLISSIKNNVKMALKLSLKSNGDVASFRKAYFLLLPEIPAK